MPLLSRIQFGFVISFHILFPAFTIGLASWLGVPRMALAAHAATVRGARCISSG
jgi:cytochrome bd-type quinol oxidase subunit 1